MCVVSVVEPVCKCMCVCVGGCVCAFISGKLNVAPSLLRVNTVSRGNLFTYAHRSPARSVSDLPLPSALSAAYGKVFTIESCKQTILSLPFPAPVSETVRIDPEKRLIRHSFLLSVRGFLPF